MRRRTVIAAAGSLATASCIDRPTGSTARPPDGDRKTDAGVRQPFDGGTVRFAVTDSGAPTTERATASFDGAAVTVTGSVDPNGCDRPTLGAVTTGGTGSRVVLTVGYETPYGSTATVACGNASYEYRARIAVDDGPVTAVEVVHEHRSTGDRRFTLRREA